MMAAKPDLDSEETITRVDKELRPTDQRPALNTLQLNHHSQSQNPPLPASMCTSNIRSLATIFLGQAVRGGYFHSMMGIEKHLLRSQTDLGSG